MYTILVNDENELITSVKKRIMQRSSLVDSFHILVPQYYGDDEYDMTEFTAYMEYLLPVSKSYKTEMLEQSEELYTIEGSDGTYVEYKLPFDTKFTTEPGEIEIQLSFIKVDINDEEVEEGSTTPTGLQYVRKTSTTTIYITPITAWSDIITDEALTAIDQKIIDLQKVANQINQGAAAFDLTKADNIGLNEDGDLQLKAKGTFIGDAISVAIPEAEDDDDGDADGVIDLNSIYI